MHPFNKHIDKSRETETGDLKPEKKSYMYQDLIKNSGGEMRLGGKKRRWIRVQGSEIKKSE